MRVTEGMKYASATRNLARLQSDYQTASQEASSGKRLITPSSDPLAAADWVKARSSAARVQSTREAMKVVQGDAQQAEAALAEANSLIQRANELAVQGANDPLTANERAMLAREVDDIRKQLIDIGNARGAHGYLFAGTKTDQPAFDAAGTFQGDNNSQLAELGPGLVRAVSTSGAQAFTAAGGRDIFADLAQLTADLNADNRAGIAAGIDSMKSASQQIVREQARAGMTLRQLEASDNVLAQSGIDLEHRASQASDADAVDAFTRLSDLQGTLERAIGVTKTVLTTSALDRF